VTVPSGVETSSEPPGPIVSAPAAVTGPTLKRMTFGSLSVARVGRTPSFWLNALIPIASTVALSIVVVTTAESPGPAISTLAFDPGGSTLGSSTPVRTPFA
jgi:hypothetical protein